MVKYALAHAILCSGSQLGTFSVASCHLMSDGILIQPPTTAICWFLLGLFLRRPQGVALPPCKNNAKSTECDRNNSYCCSDKGVVCASCNNTQAVTFAS